jgi:hypothetical protein
MDCFLHPWPNVVGKQLNTQKHSLCLSLFVGIICESGLQWGYHALRYFSMRLRCTAASKGYLPKELVYAVYLEFYAGILASRTRGFALVWASVDMACVSPEGIDDDLA